jgi:S1-C subfamily serine protease
MVVVSGLPVVSLRLTAADADIRRDATVDAVQAVMPCVVNIGTESVVEVNDDFENFFRQFYGPRYEIRPSLGSGVIIDEDGYILTNQHVVRRARRIQIKLAAEAGGQEYEAEFISSNEKLDIALLRIIQNPKDKPRKFKAIKMAKDDDLLLGETVLALGNPYGLECSVSRGILSSKRRAEPKENQELGISNWLQTDASINPGNSGGPIIDLRGELIGLSEAIMPGAQGIGFAIPVKEVREAVARIFVPESNLRWLGLQVIPATSPLVVQAVQTNSPADKAGLKMGDAILQVNGRAPTGFEFHKWIRDDTNLNFTLTIQRGAERLTLPVHLVAFSEVIKQRMGVDVQDLNRNLARQFGLEEHSGVLITGVEKNGPAGKSGIERYHILVGLNGVRVRNLFDAFWITSLMPKGVTAEAALLVPKTRRDEIIGYRQGTTRLQLR